MSDAKLYLPAGTKVKSCCVHCDHVSLIPLPKETEVYDDDIRDAISEILHKRGWRYGHCVECSEYQVSQEEAASEFFKYEALRKEAV